ncbi:MAG: conjugal transfer protein [Peptoanaerobacter stomatis]|uniref:conjugal transfer protein n=1 Tax=Peptoanaerobacter stomatis TaxID=796937 RepID=UPI003FA03101
MAIFIAIYIGVILGALGLFFFAGATVVRLTLFTLDKFALFIAAWYYTHKYFSLKFSSGNAIYFWDIVFSLLAVVFYTLLFRLLYNRFQIVGKIINFGISFLGAMTVYCMLVNGFVTNGKSHYLPLLNHNTMNVVVNYIMITILAFIVFAKREEQLNEDL